MSPAVNRRCPPRCSQGWRLSEHDDHLLGGVRCVKWEPTATGAISYKPAPSRWGALLLGDPRQPTRERPPRERPPRRAFAGRMSVEMLDGELTYAQRLGPTLDSQPIARTKGATSPRPVSRHRMLGCQLSDSADARCATKTTTYAVSVAHERLPLSLVGLGIVVGVQIGLRVGRVGLVAGPGPGKALTRWEEFRRRVRALDSDPSETFEHQAVR